MILSAWLPSHPPLRTSQTYACNVVSLRHPYPPPPIFSPIFIPLCLLFLSPPPHNPWCSTAHTRQAFFLSETFLGSSQGRGHLCNSKSSQLDNDDQNILYFKIMLTLTILKYNFPFNFLFHFFFLFETGLCDSQHGLKSWSSYSTSCALELHSRTTMPDRNTTSQ